MNRWEADKLGQILATGWPRGNMSGVTWSEQLIDLRHAQAAETVKVLTRSDEQAPSVARFFVVYRGLQTAHTPEHREHCNECDGMGLVVVEAPDYHHPECPKLPPVTWTTPRGHTKTAWPCVGSCHAAIPCPKCKR